MRRLDYLGRDCVFGGIVDDQGFVRQVVGAVMPATFVLRCVRQYALTQEEVQQHEERQRMAEEQEAREAARSRSRAHSRAASSSSRMPSRSPRPPPSDHGLT